MKGGRLYYDMPIGILCLESLFPKPRGHMRNPLTYGFPTVTRVIRGVDIPRLLFNPTPDLLEPFIQAAKELEADGVQTITGSCGFMARFQSQIAAELHIPVFLSSLLQLPLVRLMHGEKAEIGVLTASSQALTPAHFANCATPMESVHIRGMEGNPEFWETIIEGKRHDFDMERLEAEIVGSAAAFAREKALDALVLECTDLSAFSAPHPARDQPPRLRHQFARRVRLLRRLPEGLLASYPATAIRLSRLLRRHFPRSYRKVSSSFRWELGKSFFWETGDLRRVAHRPLRLPRQGNDSPYTPGRRERVVRRVPSD